MKRLLDIIFSLSFLLIFSLVLIIIVLSIKVIDGSPIIFKQTRPGLQGIPFTFYKFRTMSNKRDKNGNLLPDEARLTKFGRLLRKTSLDELPSLWNVLKGDMSLVGPRPLLMEYLDRYTPEQASRHKVKPGITGWAQVNGRNAITWEEKFKLDVWYVDNKSFLLDMKILSITIWKVFKGEGINQPGQATAEEFRGNMPTDQACL